MYNMIVSWRWGPKATGNPWRANTIEWQVSSPPPIFNFDQIPRVVGGPYEFGVPGARHAIMGGEEAEVRQPEPATAGAAAGGGSAVGGSRE
jgi:cytochrome c oxidase subunit 1